MDLRYRNINETDFKIHIGLVGIYIAEVSSECNYLHHLAFISFSEQITVDMCTFAKLT